MNQREKEAYLREYALLKAKGKKTDRRADVWAFEVVLYELLTGQRMFDGETVAETLASVMKEPIPLGHLPSDTPGPIREKKMLMSPGSMSLPELSFCSGSLMKRR